MNIKNVQITLLLIVAILLSSCNSLESDAKKLAELQCKSQKMMEKIQSGDMSEAAANMNFALEAAELAEELEGKYTTEEEQEEFEKAVLKAMKNCK